MKSRLIYIGINIIFTLIIIASMFQITRGVLPDGFISDRMPYLLSCVVIVQGLKAFKIYFIMFGKNIAFKENIKLYSKTAAADILFPFGLGKIFQIYNYGYYIGSYLKGLIAILINTFFSMAGFATVIMLMRNIYNVEITYMFYGILVILVGIMALYLVFFQMYRYWKKYFIRYKASKRGNKMLEILEQLKNLYSEISQIINGRSAVLYIVSLLIWIVEFVGVTLALGISGVERIDECITCYFTGNVFLSSSNIELRQYIFMHYCLLIVTWGIAQLLSFVLKGNKHE